MKARRTRFTLRNLVAAFALAGLPGSVSAQIVTVPPDLAPGAGYRLIFVTSVASAAPALAALGTTWTAVAETATVSAQDTGTNPMIVGGTPTNPGVPFYRLDGARVANDNTYFWSMAFPWRTSRSPS